MLASCQLPVTPIRVLFVLCHLPELLARYQSRWDPQSEDVEIKNKGTPSCSHASASFKKVLNVGILVKTKVPKELGVKVGFCKAKQVLAASSRHEGTRCKGSGIRIMVTGQRVGVKKHHMGNGQDETRNQRARV